MDEPTSYFDPRIFPTELREKIKYIKKANIAAEMSTPKWHIEDATVWIYNRNARTGRIYRTFFSIYDPELDNVKALRENLLNEILRDGDYVGELSTGTESKLTVFIGEHRYLVDLTVSNLQTEIDKTLFVRILEEYIDMVENREAGEVIITTSGDVIKKIRD